LSNGNINGHVSKHALTFITTAACCWHVYVCDVLQCRVVREALLALRDISVDIDNAMRTTTTPTVTTGQSTQVYTLTKLHACNMLQHSILLVLHFAVR
jgi:hypothetical protein